MSLLNADSAILRAKSTFGKLAKSRLKVAFEAADAKTARLVQRIDHGDEYYYVVTFTVADRETARVIVGASDGKLQQASGVDAGGKALPRQIPEPDAMRTFIAKADTLERLPFRVREGMIGLHPVLVWRPCRESTTPFLPFYQFSVGNSFAYLRVDGQVFGDLTTGPA